MDFPVYVDVTKSELQTRLQTDQMSFKRRVAGSTTESLPYEVVSFDKPTGRLRAWVLLPRLSSAADNVFELQYGDISVAEGTNRPDVWRGGFKAVFHLESANNPIADSRDTYPATGTVIANNASLPGKLGQGLYFDNNQNCNVSFANPITGSGPSTISAWVRPNGPLGKESLVALGDGAASRARWLSAQFNVNQVGLGLFNDEWLNTGVEVENQAWKLLHWTYNNQVSRLYLDGELVGTHTHANPANTQGAQAWLGNTRAAGFDTDACLRGTLDEVRISDVERSAGWILTEFKNQTEPDFAEASDPQGL